MNQQQRAAITGFATSIKELKEAGVIRSHRYLGDIGEFLCASAFGIDLATNLREIGHDGLRMDLRVQIKYAGGTKTNVDLGDPSKYDELYVVLSKESVVRSYPHDADYLIYKFTSAEVVGIGKTTKGRYSCGLTYFRRTPDEAIFLSSSNRRYVLGGPQI